MLALVTELILARNNEPEKPESWDEALGGTTEEPIEKNEDENVEPEPVVPESQDENILSQIKRRTDFSKYVQKRELP